MHTIVIIRLFDCEPSLSLSLSLRLQCCYFGCCCCSKLVILVAGVVVVGAAFIGICKMQIRHVDKFILKSILLPKAMSYKFQYKFNQMEYRFSHP